MEFQGFSPETVDFLWGIRFNNHREWFEANKKTYQTQLYEPMKALGRDLLQALGDEPGTLVKVSRIYKDARMHPVVPYKESLWICIRRDVEWWAEEPCLFFEINPEGVDYGMIFWKPKVAALEAFRQELLRQPEPFLWVLKQAQEATGVAVTADLYKRPKPCDDPRVAEFFAWKGNIACVRHEDFGENTYSPELSQRVQEFLTDLVPLTNYLRYAISIRGEG